MARRQAVRHELDEIDRKIILALKADGRATNQQIARGLGISAATVSARIRRLEQTNTLRVVAVSDFAALGYKVLLAIGVEVAGRSAEKVARDLAKLPGIFAVHLVTGAREIEILVGLRDYDDLEPFLLRDIARVRGIASLAASVAADVVKFNFDQAFLT